MAEPKLDKGSPSLTPHGDTLRAPGDDGRRQDHQTDPNIDVPPKPGQPLPNPENPDLPGSPAPNPNDPGQGQPIPPEMDTTQPRL